MLYLFFTQWLRSSLYLPFLFSIVFLSHHVSAEQGQTFSSSNDRTVVLNKETHAQALGSYMDFIVDTEGKLSFKEIQKSDAWRQVEGDNIIGGFTDAIYWVRFTVENKQAFNEAWILEVDYPIIDFIEFYQETENNQYNKILAGDKYPFHERPIEYRNVAFPITSPAKSTQTFYLRFKTESSMYIALNMLPKNTFSEIMDGKLLIFGLIYGVIFLATIYCLINAVFLRERM